MDFARAGVKIFVSDYAFFEYTASLASAQHAEKEGERVHCITGFAIPGSGRWTSSD
jgi:hypothetical protein